MIHVPPPSNWSVDAALRTLIHRAAAGARLPDRPARVAGADWQPGVIPSSNRKRVFLDGEPVGGAIAAKSGRHGWVDVVVSQVIGGCTIPRTERRHGRIEVRPSTR